MATKLFHAKLQGDDLVAIKSFFLLLRKEKKLLGNLMATRSFDVGLQVIWCFLFGLKTWWPLDYSTLNARDDIMATRSFSFFHLETWWPSNCSTLNYEKQFHGHQILFFFFGKPSGHQVVPH